MDLFARTVIGYHGCRRSFARGILNGKLRFAEWQPSQNAWDWLGHGIYFWEHSPDRALRWARARYQRHAAVLGAVIQLGKCFDLLDESITSLLAEGFVKLKRAIERKGGHLPNNKGKVRKLDCLVINDCLDQLFRRGAAYDTVRGAFLEGDPVYPDAGFSRETHVQIAVRNPACLLGIFLPNL